ncbi:ArsR family transcriptional regulator [Paenibacillus oralis]|uniref:ArsR family transcriptional regulator n=1 Tax=Paenibacillus oralis TaxID=2490856 RepID=A0A3P3U8H3_9BACL|nr:ArsR family transcriptional regulator [Paenibacillus oralis]RRJ65888.1 ArsR family transcriptional regulator [Paenibacillus oralis]
MAYDVKVDYSLVYELLSSFMIYTTRKWVNNLDVGAEWIEEIQNRFKPEVRQQFAEAAGFPFSDYDVLFVWILERGTADDVLAFLNDLAEADVNALWQRTKSYIPDVTCETIVRIRDNYIPLLKTWHQVYFSDVQPQLLPLLEEDAAEKNALLEKMDTDALIEYASGGLVLEPQKPVSQVVLTPSTHFRPINTYVFYRDVLFIQYPLDIPEVDEDEPPVVLKRLTRALAKPERLRLLRYVADEPKSIYEMLHDLNESKEDLMHDLMRLRVAGLLRIHLVDQDIEKFSIRPDGAAELQIFLESYIRL